MTNAENWTPPTVDEVNELWLRASEILNIEVSKLHNYIGIGERAARRWRSQASAIDGNKSIIRYGYFALLVGIVEGRSILGFKAYNPELIEGLNLPTFSQYNPTVNYCELIGSLLRLSLSEFAKLIAVDYTTVYRASRAEVCPKWIYGLICLAAGMSPRVLFK
ncbi:hypothetical protein L4D09_00215 [Photobacterium makurazakiensis]|uniref:hypothetical protein n=1 Tax=Photobacterium makurazakiensis TaxID=2910234 RepID=UPI003D13F23B